MGVKVLLDSRLLRAPQQPLPPRGGLLLGVKQPVPRVLLLLPTPPLPPMAAARAWAVEHARVLAPMLVGGVCILGAYAPLSGEGASQKQIDLAVNVARDVVRADDACAPVVIYGAPRGKLAAKEVLAVADGVRSASVRELSGLLDGLVSVCGRVTLQPVSVPVQPTQSQTDAETLCAAVMRHRYEHAVIKLDEQRRVVVEHPQQQPSLADVMEWELKSTGKKNNLSFVRREPLRASLFLPMHLCDSQLESLQPASSSIQLSGCMHFEAVVMQDASVGTVLDAVRQDLCNSIRARLNLLHDADEHDADEHDADEHDTDEHSQHEQPHEQIAQRQTPTSRAMPRRVMATPLQSAPSSIPFCDYVMSGETVEDDVTDRIAEVLSWDHAHLENVRIQAVEEPTRLSTTVKRVTFDDAPQQDGPSSMMALDAAEGAPSAVLTNGIIAAVIIAIIAIILKEIVWVYF